MADGLLGVLVYYGYVLVGAVSLGYLVLRVTVPEVRARLPEEKLGASALLGFLTMGLAMVLDILLFGLDRFLSARGFTPGLAVFTTLLAFAALKAYTIYYPPEFLTVGVPLSEGPAPGPVAQSGEFR
jgi:hypothetical protein